MKWKSRDIESLWDDDENKLNIELHESTTATRLINSEASVGMEGRRMIVIFVNTVIFASSISSNGYFNLKTKVEKELKWFWNISNWPKRDKYSVMKRTRIDGKDFQIIF